MAIYYTRHDSYIGLKQQTAWGTAEAADAVFEALPNSAVSVDPDVQLRRPDRSYSSVDGGSRQPDVRDITNDTLGAAPKLTGYGGDVIKSDLALLLYGVTQNVTEAATTPYKKIFTFPATQPDLTVINSVDDPGIIFSICHRHPIASTSEEIIDAILTKLDLSVEAGAGDDRLQFSADFMGRGAMVTNFNPSGTWTRAANAFFPFHDIGGLKTNFGGAVSQDILSFNMSIVNNAVPAGVKVAATHLFHQFVFGPYQVTGTVRIPYSAAAQTLLGNLATGADGTIQLWWGTETPAANGDLKFEINAVITTAPRELDYKGVHCITFNFENVTDKANSIDDSLTITLCDAVERTWVSA